jgi:hypothetical protein
VQTFALVILNHIDTIERAKSDKQQLKHSLIATGEWDYKKLFPEYETKEEVKDIEEGEGPSVNDVWDTTQVEWKSPTEDPGEFERLMASLQSSPGTFSGSDLVVQDQEITWGDWE